MYSNVEILVSAPVPGVHSKITGPHNNRKMDMDHIYILCVVGLSIIFCRDTGWFGHFQYRSIGKDEFFFTEHEDIGVYLRVLIVRDVTLTSELDDCITFKSIPTVDVHLFS